MERIKQALERAREERQRISGVGAFTSRRDQSAPAAKAPVKYTQTRTINVSAETLRENRIVGADLGSAVADAYKILRTRVLHRMRAKNWTSLAITSANENNGKTLTALNLAVSMAREVNHTVLLVDLDLRRPSVARHFTDESLPGLSDYLLHGTPLQDILFNPGIDRLVVLPGNQALANSSEMLSSPAMVSLIEEIKTRYASRLIIFDMPTLMATDDVLAFSPLTDALLLVVEEGRTRRDELAQVPALLHGMNLLGVVLNKSADPITAYY